MTDLKPCPFCGRKNIADYLSESGEILTYCIDCFEDTNGHPDRFDVWNTRPIEDALRAELDDLKKRLEIAENRVRNYLPYFDEEEDE